MSKVAIIGSGLVGRAWAISFARAGHHVAIWDQADDAAVRALDQIPDGAGRPRRQQPPQRRGGGDGSQAYHSRAAA